MFDPSGGISLAGTAAIDFHEALHTLAVSGGLTLGGTAPMTLVGTNTVVTAQITRNQDDTITVFWEGMGANGYNGTAVNLPEYDIESVQFIGTFGDSVYLYGTNAVSGAGTYVVLKDRNANAISSAAAAMFDVASDPMWVKPSAGGSISDVDVYAHFTRKH